MKEKRQSSLGRKWAGIWRDQTHMEMSVVKVVVERDKLLMHMIHSQVLIANKRKEEILMVTCKEKMWKRIRMRFNGVKKCRREKR